MSDRVISELQQSTIHPTETWSMIDQRVIDAGNFIDVNGLNVYPQLFQIKQTEHGSYLGLSLAATETLGIDISNQEQICLERVTLGEQDQEVLLITKINNDKHTACGMVTSQGIHYPFKQPIKDLDDISQLNSSDIVSRLDITQGQKLDQINDSLSLTEQLAHMDRLTLERALIDKLQDGWEPDSAQLKFIACMLLADRVGYAHSITDLPWPAAVGSLDDIVATARTPELRKQEAQILYSAGFIPTEQVKSWGSEYFDHAHPALEIILNKMLMSADQKTIADIGSFIVDLNQFFFDEKIDTEWDDLLTVVFNNLDLHSDAALDFGNHIVNLFNNQPDSVYVGNTKLVINHEEYTQHERLFLFTVDHRQEIIYRALAKGDYSEATICKVTGLLLRSSTVSGELNILRGLLTQEMSAEEHQGIENQIRRILGFWGVDVKQEVPVYAALDQLYKAIKFEEYSVSHSTESTREAMLLDTFNQLGIQGNDAILDLGSGTGWLTALMRKHGYAQAYGLDYSTRNVQVATESFGDFYDQGNWYDLKSELEKSDKLPHKCKLIMSLGRSLPHTENQPNFEKVMHEACDSLEDGGYFIFDMPNPEVGSYRENVMKYRDVIRGFGFTDQELEKIWMVVDSPDGNNFYNRFVPPEKLIRDILRNQGFELVPVRITASGEITDGVVREVLPNGLGDENLVFICRKIKKTNITSTYRKVYPSSN